jgi:hypothetical protein
MEFQKQQLSELGAKYKSWYDEQDRTNIILRQQLMRAEQTAQGYNQGPISEEVTGGQGLQQPSALSYQPNRLGRGAVKCGPSYVSSYDNTSISHPSYGPGIGQSLLGAHETPIQAGMQTSLIGKDSERKRGADSQGGNPPKRQKRVR